MPSGQLFRPLNSWLARNKLLGLCVVMVAIVAGQEGGGRGAIRVAVSGRN